jgi:uncharacterized protein (TIGR02246 family)
MTEFIVADSGVRQLYARYIDAVWRKDADAFGQCFAANGEWKIAGMHLRGRAEISAAIARLLGGYERVLMTVSAPVLEVGAGTATGRVHCLEYAKFLDGSSVATIGIYYERYVEEEGRWRFQWRQWALQYRGPVDLSAQFVNSPEYGPFPNMPGPDEPTAVRKT